ncbi:MAG: LamG domain-containing protein [Candidatus Paceibacterota bacterium]
MNKSFTLIEILVVIVIIGIISAFIIVSMTGVSSKATIAKSQAFANSLKNSLLLNLVSEWRLDDASGTTVQDQWGANPGAWSGAGGGAYTSPSWRTSTECVSNGCLAFDGTDDYVNCGNNDSLKNISNAITIGYWAYVNSYPVGNYSFFVSKGYAVVSGESWSPGMTTAGTGYFFIRSGDNSTYSYPEAGAWTKIPLRTWVYMTHVFDGANTYAATYQNGRLDKEKTDMSFNSMYVSNNPVRLGNGSATDRYFNGLLDDVRIYNNAVPTSQIEQNYCSGLNKLLANNSINSQEYVQRLVELKYGLAQKRR